MKSEQRDWNWLVIVFVMLLTQSLFGHSSDVLYPGAGTTLNGKNVYFSVWITTGSQIQTANAASIVTFAGAEVEIAPNSGLTIGSPIVLDCGSVIMRSGSMQVSDGSLTVTSSTGQSVRSASRYCDAALPDSPSAVQNNQPLAASRGWITRKSRGAPTAAIESLGPANWSFRAIAGAVFGSSVVSAELMQRCLKAAACNDLPSGFRSRLAMYGVGLPAAAAVSYFGYYLQSKHSSWWWVPEALTIGANVVVSTHAADFSHRK